jgi:hypothetical protein
VVAASRVTALLRIGGQDLERQPESPDPRPEDLADAKKTLHAPLERNSQHDLASSPEDEIRSVRIAFPKPIRVRMEDTGLEPVTSTLPG